MYIHIYKNTHAPVSRMFQWRASPLSCSQLSLPFPGCYCAFPGSSLSEVVCAGVSRYSVSLPPNTPPKVQILNISMQISPPIL